MNEEQPEDRPKTQEEQELILAGKEADSDRWKMIELLDAAVVWKRDVPERYQRAWTLFFEKAPRARIMQSEYSKLYRWMIENGEINDNF